MLVGPPDIGDSHEQWEQQRFAFSCSLLSMAKCSLFRFCSNSRSAARWCARASAKYTRVINPSYRRISLVTSIYWMVFASATRGRVWVLSVLHHSFTPRSSTLCKGFFVGIPSCRKIRKSQSGRLFILADMNMAAHGHPISRSQVQAMFKDSGLSIRSQKSPVPFFTFTVGEKT